MSNLTSGQRVPAFAGGGVMAAADDSKAEAFASLIIATFIVGIIVVAFCFTSDEFLHWFVVPVSICGILMGVDAVDWFRGRLDLYDPIGLLGVVGFHFFFLAPLLHVKWDFWMNEVTPPADWRTWLGYMGLLNVAGLIFYRVARMSFAGSIKPRETFWEVEKNRLYILLPIFVAISTAAQVWVYKQMGGIVGYMETRLTDPTQFVGMGWIFMISESAPILIAFLVIVMMERRKINWSMVMIALAILFVIQMFFGGLRGSRSETVQLLFWVVGCIHFLLRPVPRRFVYIGCAFLFAFMYLYGFYKELGPGATDAYFDSAQREQVEAQRGRTAAVIVLGDFGRSDVQSFILYRLIEDPGDFTYAKGRTYLGALALLIPSAILPDKPETKLQEGTEIEVGTGGYVPGVLWSSRVYGLAGEAMLNFGPISVPFIYGIFGVAVGWFRRFMSSLMPGDARFLLVPFGIYVCLVGLSSDSDNLIFGLAKDGFLPILVVILCSARWKLFAHNPAPSGASQFGIHGGLPSF
jgi:hypothetical protein